MACVVETTKAGTKDVYIECVRPTILHFELFCSAEIMGLTCAIPCRTIEFVKTRQDALVLIILILRVHLMIISMKIDGMGNKLLCLPGSLVLIEVDMKETCLVLFTVLAD